MFGNLYPLCQSRTVLDMWRFSFQKVCVAVLRYCQKDLLRLESATWEALTASNASQINFVGEQKWRFIKMQHKAAVCFISFTLYFMSTSINTKCDNNDQINIYYKNLLRLLNNNVTFTFRTKWEAKCFLFPLPYEDKDKRNVITK